ncbi:MAG: restriction endonuclease subunit S [Rubrimonas sp.]
MAGEWPNVPISQVATAVIGGTPSRSVAEYWGADIPWATAKDVAAISGRYLYDVEEYITQKGLENSAAKLLPKGTVVITARGTVGAVAQLGQAMSFNQTCYALLPSDALDNDFLFYALKGTMAEMRALTYGTVFETITTQTFDHWLIPLPPLPEQRAIAHILGTLDDKIELNQRVSETLEAMARALFKAWFVDFDPVRAKMEGREPRPYDDLFPDRLVDSEIGEIPEGWEVATFGDVVEQLRDNLNPLDFPEVVFRHFSIPAFDDGQWPVSEFGASIKSQKSRVPPGTLLLSKLNPEIERVWLVDVQPEDRAVCSTEFLVLAPRAPFGRAYAYCAARSPGFRQELEGLVTGTSKSHQRAHASAILGLAVVRPRAAMSTAFERIVGPLFDRTLECHRESRTLAALRDTLLPKLISGELRVKDAERFLAERGL